MITRSYYTALPNFINFVVYIFIPKCTQRTNIDQSIYPLENKNEIKINILMLLNAKCFLIEILIFEYENIELN